MPTHAPVRQHGATLIELVVALAILMALLAGGAPPVAEFLEGAKLAAASSDLVGDLHLARAEALRRNRRVTVCKSPDGLGCSSHGGWEQGWIVFGDENGNGALDDGEEVLGRHEPLPWNLRLVGNRPVAAYVSYTAVGASKLMGGGFQAGTLTICRRSGAATPARQVIVNSIGRPRVQKTTVASCV
ncbi:GspH/FimT family pseudopilin [Ramlibacter alkalitolerans]|jgi:type IV fimbrial biogenesis protein FimT|uniref:Type II secretion system protein H n=1 Tax=Ramlibacter alkalitolerans TaxID=2039631 RepID=A0ABS1JNR9_9BURK|nr:GspH/FimT family protein [Ramlibacter alkalitolerans]MBL0425902.1 GspH/FimT family pseudopilin [Ramlibacter alkalitolerans]